MSSITRRTFIGSATAGVAAAAAHRAGARTRPPNILWITCEDMSQHLGCYGDAYANTPNLDRLASQGARYTNAFTVAGVCAPSRSCLITGMYPTTLGTCHMRCNHTPPPHVRCFPTYLRRAGYYCTNNVKTDYQFDVPEDAWDESSKSAHWRNRQDPDQPFFAVFNAIMTHESQIGSLESLPSALGARIPGGLHDPAKAMLPPYYPDTEIIRKHWAHMYDLVSAMDVWAGDLLKQLEDDGLADNTAVFFFGDHGDGIPRAKRWLYDSGLRVPFLVRWPGHTEPGSVSDRMVSFVDYAPTVLSVAGVDVPGHMQGGAFLGEHDAPPRTYVFGARDRMDDRYDQIRAARDLRYKYIRNYQPDKPYDQYISYCESWPVMQELRRVQAAGELNAAQQLFFRDRKPIEELYDTEADPHELSNLADSAEHRPQLEALRRALDSWMDDAQDIGFVPETELDRFVPAARPALTNADHPKFAAPADADTTVFGKRLGAWVEDFNGADTPRRYRAIAAIGLAGPSAKPLLLSALHDSDVCIAHWAAAGLGHIAEPDASTVDALRQVLAHESYTVRLAAANALVSLNMSDLAVPAALDALKHPDIFVRFAGALLLDRVQPKTAAIEGALRAAMDDARDPREYVADVARHALGMPPQK